MLVVTRKKDEKLMIGNDIEVQVLRIGRENVRLGIKAPAEVPIYRYEIYEAIQRREKAAAAAAGSSDSESPAGSESPAARVQPAAGPETAQEPEPESPRVKAHSEGRARIP